jgi:hypothetical protein
MTLEGLNDDFQDVVTQLADAGVEFMIVGAFALAFHGAPRASGDIDLFVRPSDENATRVYSVPVIGRAALVKNKTAAGRPKDVADVARLTKTAQR